jgi:hypothetical protein
MTCRFCSPDRRERRLQQLCVAEQVFMHRQQDRLFFHILQLEILLPKRPEHLEIHRIRAGQGDGIAHVNTIAFCRRQVAAAHGLALAAVYFKSSR